MDRFDQERNQEQIRQLAPPSRNSYNNSVPSLLGGSGTFHLSQLLVPPILSSSKFLVLFGAPHNGKTINNGIKKLRFLMQNNVQFNIILV